MVKPELPSDVGELFKLMRNQNLLRHPEQGDLSSQDVLAREASEPKGIRLHLEQRRVFSLPSFPKL